MLLRFANVIYWTCCLVALGWLGMALAKERPWEESRIQEARYAGQADEQIIHGKAIEGIRYDWRAALKAGYTATEVLNHLRDERDDLTSGFDVLARRLTASTAAFIVLPALFAWLVGLAFRYVLAGR